MSEEAMSGGDPLDKLRLAILFNVVGRALEPGVSPASQRLMLVLLEKVGRAQGGAAAVVSPAHLPEEAGLSPKETTEAFRDLVGRGWVLVSERQTDLEQDRLFLVLVGGLEAASPEWAARVRFGPLAAAEAEGWTSAWVAVDVPAARRGRLRWWLLNENDIEGIRAELAKEIDATRATVADVRAAHATVGWTDERGTPAALEVLVRYRRDAWEDGLEEPIRRAVTRWFGQRLFPVEVY